MSRLFLIDPVCAQPEGHNLALLRSYNNYLNSSFKWDSTCLVVSKELSKEFASDALRVFSFQYFGILSLSTKNHNDQKPGVSNLDKEKLAELESSHFLKEQKLHFDDYIYFPGGDYYGVYGLLAAVQKMSAKKSPTLIIRFIGVLENILGGNKSLFRLLNYITDLQTMGFRVKVTAETPLYADFLSRTLGQPLIPSPHPLFNESITPHSRDNQRVVVLPGSGRLDKGFDRVFYIAREMSQSSGYENVVFKVQSLPPQNVNEHLDLATRLYALPNVDLLPSYVSTEVMHQLYRDANVILSPYAQDVYAMRGSAVMIEALDFGRLVVSQTETGFSPQLEYYGIGVSCNSNSDYVRGLKNLLDIQPEELDYRANQARYRYKIDVAAAYKELFA